MTPFPGGRIPEIGPSIAFQEWITVTTAQGMSAGEQYARSDLVDNIHKVERPSGGWHDTHGPGYHDDCWDATPDDDADDEASEPQ